MGRSGFGPRLLGVPKGLGNSVRLRFILLLKELALARCVLELLLNLGHALLELALCGLFLLQIAAAFSAAALLTLACSLARASSPCLNLGSAICNYANNNI